MKESPEHNDACAQKKPIDEESKKGQNQKNVQTNEISANTVHGARMEEGL